MSSSYALILILDDDSKNIFANFSGLTAPTLTPYPKIQKENTFHSLTNWTSSLFSLPWPFKWLEKKVKCKCKKCIVLPIFCRQAHTHTHTRVSSSPGINLTEESQTRCFIQAANVSMHLHV